MTMEPIPFALPDLTEAEVEAVVGVLRSKWLTSGPQCEEFEHEFAAAVESPNAIAVNSCTAGLHLSLEALGIGEGDLVFVPPYTFAASAEVIRYVGARPVLVDVDPVTANLDPGKLREAVAVSGHLGTPKAVMPVHFGGVACDMDQVWSVAREYGLAVVEDAAHALPSSYRDRPIGWCPPDVRGTACFSFYATKTITTGEGGMVTTADDSLAERMRIMRLHGLSRQAWIRYAGGTWKYDIVAPGFKYNLTDIAAAMGRVQLSRAEEMREKRAAIAKRFDHEFATMGVFDLPTVPDNCESSWHLYPLRLSAPLGEMERDQMIDDLKERGIGVSMHFIPLHLHSYYRKTYGYEPDDFAVSYDIYQRSISLPIYSSMTDEQVERVIAEVGSLAGGLT